MTWRSVFNNPLPSGNIYWRNIKPEDVVSLEGKPGSQYYVVRHPNGKKSVANWGGNDALEAQRFLDKRAKQRRANPAEARKEKTFYLRDYLVPGGRYPYERLPGDMEMALSQGFDVSLISVPGFLMVLGYPGSKKPWCNTSSFKMKCFKTAREAIRG